MKKVILIDGNNLLFRSYYATAYNGMLMKNSKGFATNAVYGFASMIQKIITEEKPEYMIVAFDKGKTFRHEMYKDYKAGRAATPDELLNQFPKAKELLDCLGIFWTEIDNYEADDILGTIAKKINEDPSYNGLIISSDKDLMQLVSNQVEMKVLKQKDYLKLDINNFREVMGVNPINIIDLKALQGDSSDNIPGVRGIGEKTATKLIGQYETIENLYEHLDEVSPKVKENLTIDKESAFFSKKLATIYLDVPLNLTLDDLIVKEPDNLKLKALYEELEFYSLIKKMNLPKEEIELKYEELENISDLDALEDAAIYVETDNENYHLGSIKGIGYYSKNKAFYIPKEKITKEIFENKNIATYDIKKNIVSLKKLGIESTFNYDLMLVAYLLNYNLKEDIAYLANQLGYEVDLQVKDENTFKKMAVLKAKCIYETKETMLENLEKEGMLKLYEKIEKPLSFVLADMEIQGVKISKEVLDEMNKEINIKLELLENEIYNMAGEEFNISSTRQLGVILFEKLGLKNYGKSKRGYSTSRSVLDKLVDEHPIASKVIEHRTLSKLHSTYIEGLYPYILEDGKIHTIYNQVLARTGRLSSTEPNLQNIPVRYEYGKLIRKAFVPRYDEFISGDYSQIELRILAHMSKAPNLIEAFNSGMDIHTKTAMDIFDVEERYVTKDMRRSAKAVNFGIVYGMSSFGLSENLDIDVNEAKKFIDKYLNTFSGIKNYLDGIKEKARSVGYVTTLFNRKRKIEELSNKNYMIRQAGERMALNTPIQGTSADIIKMAMIKIHEELKKENMQSKMILQVHDELIFDVKENEKEKLENIVKKGMEQIVSLDVPLEVELDYGSNWYDTK